MESFDENIGDTLMQKERELLEISRQRYSHLEDKIMRRDIEIQSLQHKVNHLNQNLSHNLNTLENKDNEISELYEKLNVLKYTVKEREVEISELKAYLSAAEQRAASEVQKCQAKEKQLDQSRVQLHREMAGYEEVRESQNQANNEKISKLKRKLKAAHNLHQAEVEQFNHRIKLMGDEFNTKNDIDFRQISQQYDEQLEDAQTELRKMQGQVSISNQTIDNLKQWHDQELASAERSAKHKLDEAKSQVTRMEEELKHSLETTEILETDYKRKIASLEEEWQQMIFEVDRLKEEQLTSKRQRHPPADESGLQRTLHKYKKKLVKRDRKIAEMNQAVLNYQNKLHEMQSNLERAVASAERRAAKSDNSDKLKKQQEEFWNLKGQFDTVQQEAQHWKTRYGVKEAEVIELRDQHHNLIVENDSRSDYAQLQSQLQNARRQMEGVEQERARLSQKMMTSIDESNYRDKIAQYEIEMSTLNVRNENLEAKLAAVGSSYTEYEGKYKTTKNQLQDFDKENALLKRANQRLENENMQILAERDQLMDISSNLRAESRAIESPQKKIEELEKKLNDLSKSQAPVRDTSPNIRYVDQKPVGNSERETKSQRAALHRIARPISKGRVTRNV